MSHFVKITKLENIPPGARYHHEFAEETVVILNTGGQLYCIADLCTHDDGPLEDGLLEGCEIECPRHGARFDIRTGKATQFPAVAPVPTYAVKVVDGYVYVAAPE